MPEGRYIVAAAQLSPRLGDVEKTRSFRSHD
jgi:hypothetical protein